MNYTVNNLYCVKSLSKYSCTDYTQIVMNGTIDRNHIPKTLSALGSHCSKDLQNGTSQFLEYETVTWDQIKRVQRMSQHWYLFSGQKLLCQKSFACLAKNVIFVGKCTAVSIPKLENKMLHWMFWRNELILNNFFHIKKNITKVLTLLCKWLCWVVPQITGICIGEFQILFAS